MRLHGASSSIIGRSAPISPISFWPRTTPFPIFWVFIGEGLGALRNPGLIGIRGISSELAIDERDLRNRQKGLYWGPGLFSCDLDIPCMTSRFP